MSKKPAVIAAGGGIRLIYAEAQSCKFTFPRPKDRGLYSSAGDFNAVCCLLGHPI